MKRLFIILALTALLAPDSFAAFRRDPPKALLARVTVYWASGGRGSDRYTRQHKCATGLRLRHGHCAVDPKKIAYGSNIVFPDGTSLAAVDTGTALPSATASGALALAGDHRAQLVGSLAPGASRPRLFTNCPPLNGSEGGT